MQESSMYNIGVEREGLRCTEEGELADSPHPKIFGDRMKNDFITTDFGEAQLELRTQICKSTEECYNKLTDITNVVLCELNEKKEFLWPYSMPCILPKEEDFVFGDYGEDKEEAEYEMKLYKKYGYQMHCISGIHVNFSFDKNFYEKMLLLDNSIPKDTDEAYFKIMQNFMKKAWILIYFLSATPLKCDSNETSCLSIRNSVKQGFGNQKQLDVDFSNKESYVKSIEENLKTGKILSPRELYIPIRAKSKNKNNIVEELKTQEVDHIEVRLCDINPFDKSGITKNDLDLIVVFLFYCLLDNTNENVLNYKEIAERGLTKKEREALLVELDKFSKINDKFELDCESAIQEMRNRCSKDLTKAKQIRRKAQKCGLKDAILELAFQYAKDSEREKYFLKKHPMLESSTVAIIKDAISQGIDFNVISEEKNFIELIKDEHKEYIIQATRTSKDSYIFPFITDDKYFAKRIMKENGLNVPNGIMINKEMNLKEKTMLISRFYDTPVVIKPRTTNYGIGITVFRENTKKEQIEKAIEYAFQFDNDVLLEEYADGREYRFVVIDGKCVSVVWRRSASVVGDGYSTISELIKKKDKEPWHYLLANPMVIDQPLRGFLKKQGLSFDDIPKQNERIFLRDNSNCSTGGESEDMTDRMPENFKQIAETAAKSFNAKICGVDILVDDLNSEKYNIIEINDNPGICINEWPYEGKGERVGLHILKLLEMC